MSDSRIIFPMMLAEIVSVGATSLGDFVGVMMNGFANRTRLHEYFDTTLPLLVSVIFLRTFHGSKHDFPLLLVDECWEAYVTNPWPCLRISSLGGTIQVPSRGDGEVRATHQEPFCMFRIRKVRVVPTFSFFLHYTGRSWWNGRSGMWCLVGYLGSS
jgi:hypothetical protein